MTTPMSSSQRSKSDDSDSAAAAESIALAAAAAAEGVMQSKVLPLLLKVVLEVQYYEKRVDIVFINLRQITIRVYKT